MKKISMRRGILMEENIFEQFPNKEAFNKYWEQNYKPVIYEDVREQFCSFVKSVEGHVYVSDYEAAGCVSKEDFKENLSDQAKFAFEDGLAEIFYDKNPRLYETAFALYEEAMMSGSGDANVAQIFHDTFQKVYKEVLDRLYDEALEGNK